MSYVITDHSQIVNSNVILKKYDILFFTNFQAQVLFLWKEFAGFFDELFKPDTSHAGFGTWRLIKNQVTKFRSLPLDHDHQVTISNLLVLTL